MRLIVSNAFIIRGDLIRELEMKNAAYRTLCALV